MTDNMGLVPMSAELTMFYHDFESSLAFAAQQERERIIKLLEGIAITTKNDEVAVMELLSAIVALIKGEQK